MPSPERQGTGGTQGRGGLVEDGAHQRGLVAAGERAGGTSAIRTGYARRPEVHGGRILSVNLATRTSRQRGYRTGLLPPSRLTAEPVT
jgi:hypothetical protein